MNNGPGRGPGPRPGRPRGSRTAAVITVTAAAMLSAACGGSPPSAGSGGSPNAGGPANSPAPVAYSRCMRSHGIPDFPGPDGSGQIPKEEILQLRVSTSVLQAAQRACQRLWPYQAPTQAQLRQQLTDDVTFARCMRSHGVPDFPDPTVSDGRAEFVISVSRVGMNVPQLLAKARECQHVLPAGTPLPEATVAP